MTRFRLIAVCALVALLIPSFTRADVPPVRVVIFTHIEDNTPGGLLGSPMSRQSYTNIRGHLIAMADLALSHAVPWTLQPDWKILEAALLYEDSTMRSTTQDKHLFRFLKEDRSVIIDPHSHENGGYNYTDVAHLLDSLGVGATTVIGGHIWDPTLEQFAEWDRFRVPVAGQHYPNALWRGDILIGSGTPNHVNDPILSGVWRPRDRDHYFEHDPLGNIAAIGNWKRSIESIGELIALYRDGVVPPTAMLTFATNVNPMTISAPGGLAAVADTVFEPIAAWRDSGLVEPTDFTSLIATWLSDFGGESYLHVPASPVGVVEDLPGGTELAALGPIHGAAPIAFSLAGSATRPVDLEIFDVAGRRLRQLMQAELAGGRYSAWWDGTTDTGVPARAGVYLVRLRAGHVTRSRTVALLR